MRTSNLKLIIVGLALLSVGVKHARALTTEEATSGAVAVVIVAEKCYPERAAEALQFANDELWRMLAPLPQHEKLYALDAASTKLKAMRVSGGSYACRDVAHLKNMAKQWGFGHLILESRN